MTGRACATAWAKQAAEAEARHKYSITRVILGLLAGLGLCNPCFAGSNSPQCQFGSHGNSLLTQAQCCKPKQCAFTATCKWSDGSVRAEHGVHHESCNESDSTQSMESSLGLGRCSVAVLKATGDDPPRCGAQEYPRSRSLHYLVVPTKEVKGIEEYQKVKNMHLWELAERFWDARLGKDKQLKRTRMGLAINSARDGDRTVDQLHIHVTCIKSSVYAQIAELKENATSVNNRGRVINLCGSHRYWVTYQASLDPDPFAAVAHVPGAPDNATQDKCFYGSHSVVVTAGRHSGYYILVGEHDEDESGHAEELLDESCSP